jgi:hypothetical protein
MYISLVVIALLQGWKRALTNLGQTSALDSFHLSASRNLVLVQ